MKTLLAMALTLGSIATPVLAQDPPYRAAGTEPFWSLTIDARRMTFEAPGRRPVAVVTPRVINGFAGEIYQTRRMNVNVIHASCSDGMSDRTYHDRVTVMLDGKRYEGCGGMTAVVAPPGSAIDGAWRIESIAGRRAVPGTHVTVTFDGKRMNGDTGCNAFSGAYRFERGFLTGGPLITTKRACTRFTNWQEQTLLGLFGQRLSVSSTRNGKLVMMGSGGQTLVLVRERGRP